MIQIPLTKGYYAEVDDQDALWLYQLCGNWCYIAAGKGYAGGTVKGERVYMHIEIGRKIGLQGRIDHKDGNGLNNKRDNLREATSSQNSMNRGMSSRNTTGYKGVTYHVHNKKYMASIRVDSKNKFLGYYSTPEEAHIAYKEASEKYFDEYANSGNKPIVEYKREINIEIKDNSIILAEEEENVVVPHSNNSTGYKGIEYKKLINKYRVEISKNKDRHFVGHFSNIDEAVKALKRAIYQFKMR